MGVPPDCGHLHPLLKVRSEFRQIFFEMGFSEMPTNRYVESSFWNFDALFQPQQHPARDAHDTFFISGMGQVRFKPAYNPYTEPSMEVFSFHEGLGRWVEVGNSGMFRPEMLLPMGLPEDVVVIAWGLSLERCAQVLS
ncbi:phenylalanyl-tRNA synthetase alpha chain, putative [Ixodes scapularis]|uniref:phenylalanine--tRNA ligase n=1 Tax=Ixodes scapularis TaxID=6945 RepID=B7PQU1_IXOSC|nr:phenylalanyl-tRNA synthetase alpha chain, putative [Ixodes scapularis]|eukprot:XP_002436133.1 phenylalanyl-tRNA synthetase alpha chain, putative [Ixodes scapularis]